MEAADSFVYCQSWIPNPRTATPFQAFVKSGQGKKLLNGWNLFNSISLHNVFIALTAFTVVSYTNGAFADFVAH